MTADGAVVEGLASPDRRHVAFGSSRPASPTKRSGETMSIGGGAAGTAARAGVAGEADARRSSSEVLRRAAQRLQGIGGRSVRLSQSRG